jgi:succinate dehydrogenase hydrophobic anchor subunit
LRQSQELGGLATAMRKLFLEKVTVSVISWTYQSISKHVYTYASNKLDFDSVVFYLFAISWSNSHLWILLRKCTVHGTLGMPYVPKMTSYTYGYLLFLECPHHPSKEA